VEAGRLGGGVETVQDRGRAKVRHEVADDRRGEHEAGEDGALGVDGQQAVQVIGAHEDERAGRQDVVAAVDLVEKVALGQQQHLGELVDVEGLDLLGVQQEAEFLEVREAVHSVDLAVLQEVEEDRRARLVQEAFLLERELPG
jgi:hypothetical protein